MTWDGTILDARRSLTYRHHVGDVPSGMALAVACLDRRIGRCVRRCSISSFLSTPRAWTNSCGRSSRATPKMPHPRGGYSSASPRSARATVVPQLPVHHALQGRVRCELTRLGSQRSIPGLSIEASAR